ncbi:MAG TPA: efflux RND transporter periplasmic adaptor subunit, partial [Nitrospira sp.]|nr:efflux RND transporter periplasmic adaptor subunit [Nitrospira sp.]
ARKFQAAFAQAMGDLKRAQAQLIKAQHDVTRNEPLAKEGAVSQKEFQDSVQANAVSRATVESSVAALDQARLNLEWTKILAPIDGVVGIAKAQIGDLVNSSDELTSMSQVDPIRVYFQASEQEYLKFSGLVEQAYREQGDPTKIREDGRIEMVLSNGEPYPRKGWFFLADRQVDAKTGSIRVAALFPNPGNVLRPGLYAKVRSILSLQPGALLVPQRAVSELQGRYQIALVASNHTVEFRSVAVGDRVAGDWIITRGVRAGEQVIVEGLQKVKAGDAVNPVAFGADSTTLEAASGRGSK